MGKRKKARPKAPVQRQNVKADLRRLNVMSMYLQGYRQFQIAQQLKVSKDTVSKDIKAVRNQWRLERVAQYEDYLREELVKIRMVEQAAWEGWARSFAPAETYVKKDDEEGAQVEHRIVGQAGNPGFLMVMLSCVEKRAKLMGFDQQSAADIKQETSEIVLLTVKTREDIARIQTVEQLRPHLVYEHEVANE